MGGKNGISRLCSVERYEFDTNQWTYVKQMNCQRSDASADVYEGW